MKPSIPKVLRGYYLLENIKANEVFFEIRQGSSVLLVTKIHPPRMCLCRKTECCYSILGISGIC